MSKRKFYELTEKEKAIVENHFEKCIEDKSMDCYLKHPTIEDFWETHKEMDYPKWR